LGAQVRNLTDQRNLHIKGSEEKDRDIEFLQKKVFRNKEKSVKLEKTCKDQRFKILELEQKLASDELSMDSEMRAYEQTLRDMREENHRSSLNLINENKLLKTLVTDAAICQENAPSKAKSKSFVASGDSVFLPMPVPKPTKYFRRISVGYD
jgi:hypothetical protein